MEFTQIVNVQATNDVDIGRKVRAIKRLAAEPIDEPAVDEQEDVPDVDEKPPTPVITRPWGQMDVSEVTGKRGETVEVELRGETDSPVQGWVAAIGYESNHFEFLDVHFGPFLKENGRKATELVSDRRRGEARIGNAGPHLKLAQTGWHISIPADTLPSDVDDPGAVTGGVSPALLIPPDTLLATIKFRISGSAPIASHPLLNWSMKFGKPKTRHLFTSLEHTGIDPETEDGAIVVTG